MWVVAALLLAALPSAAQAATFTVNSTDDVPDQTADGTCATAAPVRCTLRAAIQEANFGDAADTIVVPAGTYQLTLGALSVTDGDTIQGIDGAASTQVVQTGADRVFNVSISNDINRDAAISGLRISGGELGGVLVQQDGGGPFSLTLSDSTVDGNTTNDPESGGGISVVGNSATMQLTLVRSTVSGNEALNGGGIFVGNDSQVTIQNSTISGNTAADEGGGVYVRFGNGSTGTATITNSTIAENLAADDLGGGLGGFVEAITVEETIVADNLGGNCPPEPPPPTSLGNNLEEANTCRFNQNGDKPNTDPQLGPLLDNGGETQTHALPAGSPAVDAIPPGECPPPATDQRGVDRPFGPNCDIGSYELLDSRTLPSVPDCSPTGSFTLRMDPAPGETPEAFHYKVDDGPTQTVQSTSEGTATITLPEGRQKLEYWSETVEGGEEPQASHLVDTALVDKTAPNVSVASDQSQDIYVITRTASVTVNAGDPGAEASGLTVNPSAQSEPVTTSSRGAKAASWSAVDLCNNTTTKQFAYTVLGPGLGQRAVIEPLGDDVQVQLPTANGARASQKGGDFEPVTEPREIPIESIIDARDGKARITSSKSTTETDIQDGEFVAGVFQVLQSRNEKRKGLTKLRLRKGNFKDCDDAGKGASAALSRRAIRRLRARARGRFRTSGRHSAATVRGTKWTVTDRCDGTLTKVKRGKVAVRDFRLRKTITLTRGERYLALAEPPPPELGKTVNVDVLKGKVFIKLPRRGDFARASQKGTDFVPLTSARSIPVRSILDTRKGVVALRSARNRKGKIQSGRFSAGVFQVLQSRKRREKGLTTLRLTGSAAKFKRCGKAAAAGQPGAQASLSRRKIRRLRAKAKGRYRTRSKYSAATVRGTTWTATDSCAGTLTSVKRGKVAVRDFRRRKTVLLTTGKEYLARPR